MLLRCLATSAPIGAVGSVTPAPALSSTSQSSIWKPPSTSCILPWILDSGASFHMMWIVHVFLPFVMNSSHCSNY
jgi:hypothetical protein